MTRRKQFVSDNYDQSFKPTLEPNFDQFVGGDQMAKRKMVKVNTRPGADFYADGRETIIEYSRNDKEVTNSNSLVGGLISFRALDDGRIQIQLYRHDPEVVIVIGYTDDGRMPTVAGLGQIHAPIEFPKPINSEASNEQNPQR